MPWCPISGEEADTHRASKLCPRSHSWEVPNPGLEPGLSDSGPRVLTSALGAGALRGRFGGRRASSGPVVLHAWSLDQLPQRHWRACHRCRSSAPTPDRLNQTSRGEHSHLCLDKPPASRDLHSCERSPHFGKRPWDRK